MRGSGAVDPSGLPVPNLVVVRTERSNARSGHSLQSFDQVRALETPLSDIVCDDVHLGALVDQPFHIVLDAWRVTLTEDGFDLLPSGVWKNKDHAPRIVFSSNNAMAVIDATKRGYGASPLPCFLGDGEPGLARLGEPIEALTMQLWVLTHPDLRHAARVRALMNFLVTALRQQKAEIEGL